MIRSTVDAPSPSRLQCFADCQRQYFYRYHCGLESSLQGFPPAFMGSALHQGLEVFHRSQNALQASTKLFEAWGGEQFHGDWDWVTSGHANIVLQNYTEAKHTQDWDAVKLRMSDLRQDRLVETDVVEDDAGHLVLAEASFVVDVPELNGAINIRPDLLLRVPTGLRVLDHKTTTGYLGPKPYNRGKFEHQLRLYAMGMGALIGESVLEAAINAIYTGKTASSPKFKGKRFDSYVYDYSAADFEETVAFYKEGKRRMMEMAEYFTEQDELSAMQSPSDRCGYCEFAPVCSTPVAMRPGELRRGYQRRGQ